MTARGYRDAGRIDAARCSPISTPRRAPRQASTGPAASGVLRPDASVVVDAGGQIARRYRAQEPHRRSDRGARARGPGIAGAWTAACRGGNPTAPVPDLLPVADRMAPSFYPGVAATYCSPPTR